eukprot:TRINITY_DN3378_c0_g1_i1.p1 TRINITY_DN3378_c0_g1~~TRINITY_DN3378_c0_g1_i1.p1  ORF type:complete len:949 (+),score=225.77 TRINITY_DN3378_c0_g1_i1:107-2953(+)
MKKDYRAEYALSGRASCRKCKGNIGLGSLRISHRVQSPFFDGKMDMWFHFHCAKKTRRFKGATVLDVSGFDDLKWEDQQRLREWLGGSDAVIPLNDEKQAKEENGEKGEEKEAVPASSVKKRGRKRKEEKMKAVILGVADEYRNQITLERSLREQLGFVSHQELCDLAQKNGIEIQSHLRRRDVVSLVADAILFGTILPCPVCSGTCFLRRDGLYACRGDLSEWTKCTWEHIDPPRHSKVFEIPISSPSHSVVSRVLGGIAVPLRRIPPPEQQAHACLLFKDMSFHLYGRLPISHSEAKNILEQHGATISMTSDAHASTQIFVVPQSAKTSLSQSMLGKIIASIRTSRFAQPLIVSWDYVEACIRLGVRVSADSYRVSVVEADQDPEILEEELKDGEEDGKEEGKEHKRRKITSIGMKVEEEHSKREPRSVRVLMKGAAVVDAEFPEADKYHVYAEGNTTFSAVLKHTDIAKDINSFYVLQILRKDTGSNALSVWRRWGRVATTIGGSKEDKYRSAKSAKNAFCELFHDKTGNGWEARPYVKRAGKFFPVSVPNESSAPPRTIRRRSRRINGSRLTPEVEALVQQLFDVENMNYVLKILHIDVEKMPLGKLSKDSISTAYSVLQRIEHLLQEGLHMKRKDRKKGMTHEMFHSQIVDLSNQFYTLIPSTFSPAEHFSARLIDSASRVAVHVEHLDALRQMEVAGEIIKATESAGSSGEDPLQMYYQQLQCQVEMERDRSTLRMIGDYIRNTVGETHTDYTLSVDCIFRVCRESESDSHDVGNRHLLWHGSRSTNFVGILSEGLRIAPPEAPVTGYMFGKGIYFANCVTKSANYCNGSRANPIGFLLLCEVALGEIHDVYEATYFDDAPEGFSSVHGVGKRTPDPSKTLTLHNGVQVPLGTLCHRTVADEGVGEAEGRNDFHLEYDEFIVYNPKLVQLRWLVRVTFDFNG